MINIYISMICVFPPDISQSAEVKRGGVNIDKLHNIGNPWEPLGLPSGSFDR